MTLYCKFHKKCSLNSALCLPALLGDTFQCTLDVFLSLGTLEMWEMWAKALRMSCWFSLHIFFYYYVKISCSKVTEVSGTLCHLSCKWLRLNNRLLSNIVCIVPSLHALLSQSDLSNLFPPFPSRTIGKSLDSSSIKAPSEVSQSPPGSAPAIFCKSQNDWSALVWFGLAGLHGIHQRSLTSANPWKINRFQLSFAPLEVTYRYENMGWWDEFG